MGYIAGIFALLLLFAGLIAAIVSLVKNQGKGVCAVCGKSTGFGSWAIANNGRLCLQCVAECGNRAAITKALGTNSKLWTVEAINNQKKLEKEEFRKKCGVCGHIFCYKRSDLRQNISHANAALWESVGGVASAVGGSQVNSTLSRANADNALNKIVDYNKCPHCQSTDLHLLTDEEWTAEKAQAAALQTAAKTDTPALSTADELRKFKELLDSGVITEEEFDAKKKELLGL